MKVIIIQNKLMRYRLPVFNALAKIYELTVVHSGDLLTDQNVEFEQIAISVKKKGPFFIQKDLLEVISNVNAEVVIGMFDLRWLTIVFALLLTRLKKGKFILWGHRYSDSFLANLLRDFLMCISNASILYGNEEKDRIIQRGVSAKKIFTAFNTIEVKNSKDFSNCKKTCFLFVGRAQERKRIDVLIESFGKIAPFIASNITIEIVGGGDENVKLKKLCESLSISDRINFHGTITDEKKLAVYFAKAYAYISPGAVGLGVLHSLAYGVPVVTHQFQRHGPEYFNLEDKVNSLIYKDHSDLSDIMLEMINNPSLTRELGLNAYKYFKNERSIEKMLNGFIGAINYSASPLG